MTWFFLLSVGALILLMKLAAMGVRGLTARTSLSFWLSPLPSPSSLDRCADRSRLLGRLVWSAVSALALALGYRVYWDVVVPRELPPWILGYLGIPFLLLLSSLFWGVLTLVWLPTGRLHPALHRRPWLARSVADFWGHRWNLWFSDWFRYVVLVPLRRRPALAVVVVFLLSGLIHEWVVNFSLYLAADQRRFGTMMLYFPLQAAGLLIERRFMGGRRLAKVAWAWLVVVLPSPWVLNEGLLRALRLWPY
ncbi:MAG: hypothetical protein IT581_18575 [Verrucomicrobiales bacterium]|nr:hypothetical protein [Verrucomicrobiales bacterium]